MTDKRRDDGQAILDVGDPESLMGPERAGSVRAAVRSACEAAEAAGDLDRAVDQGVKALAVALGQAVDVGLTRQDPYAVSQAGRDLSAVLARMRLDPVSRGAGGDAFDELARELARVNGGTDSTTPASGS
jgi:hypothetical protein